MRGRSPAGQQPQSLHRLASFSSQPGRSVFRADSSGSTTEPQAMPTRDGLLVVGRSSSGRRWPRLPRPAPSGRYTATSIAALTIADRVGMSIDSSPPPPRGGAGQSADRPARVVRPGGRARRSSCRGLSGTRSPVMAAPKLVVARENFVTEVGAARCQHGKGVQGERQAHKEHAHRKARLRIPSRT